MMIIMQKWREVTRGLFVCTIIIAGSAVAGQIPQEFIQDLQSEEFQVRESAEAALLDWSRKDPKARVLLILDKAREAPDPEVRQRSHNVLRGLAMDEYLLDGEGFLGIQMVALRAEVPHGDGAQNREVIGITRVLRGTPAHDAELRVGDMIVSVNGEKLDAEDALTSFQNRIRAIKPGTPAQLEMLRDQEIIEIEITLGRRPPDQQGRFFGQPMMDINELARRDQERFFEEWLEKLQN